MKKNVCVGSFPGGTVVKTPHFHCRGHGFDPWLGNYDPAYHVVQAKKKIKNKKKNVCVCVCVCVYIYMNHFAIQ